MKQLYSTLFIFSLLFFLSGCLEDPEMDTRLQNASVPQLGETESAEKTATSVRVKSSVIKENGSPLENRGFKYWQIEIKDGESSSVGIARDTFETENIGKGEYSMLIKDLKNNACYEITSFASNEVGIGYGDTIQINTNEGVGDVKTSDVKGNLVTATTARVEGVISKKGEGEIIDFGFELYLNGKKDTTFTKTDGVDWSDNDSTFYYNITGLEQQTNYEVKAFVENSFGIFSQINGKKSFRTKDGRPILKDSIASKADYDFVLIGSELLNKGESEIEEIGFCWTTVKDSFRPNVEKDDTIKCVLASDGTFEGKITDLEADITYYARAFARNSFGIVYSKDSIRISKKRDLPTIFLNPTSVVKEGTVTVNGELQDEGRSPVTSVMLYYSQTKSETAPGPDAKDHEGFQEVTFDENSKVFNVPLKLLGGKKYYIRAYAKNTSGTAASEEVSYAETPPFFVKKADFSGGGREDFITFSLDNYAFVLGGRSASSGKYTNDLFGYSQSSENWAQLKSYDYSISGGSVCSVGNSVYLIGGKNAGLENISEVYSYTYNQWSSHSSMKLSGKMMGIMNAISFANKDSIIVLGGEKILVNDSRGLIVQDTVYCWNGESWNDGGIFPALIKNGVAITTGDSVIVGLGYTSKDSVKCEINRELWINTSGDWSQWESLTIAPEGMGKVSTGVIKNSCLYFIDDKGTIWMYGLDSQKWYLCSKLSPTIADSPDYKIMKIGETIYILAINNFGKSSFVTYDPTWDIANEQN